jgi:hypothetical protein
MSKLRILRIILFSPLIILLGIIFVILIIADMIYEFIKDGKIDIW